MKLSSAIPAASFFLALCLSVTAGGFPGFLALRSPQQETGCKCKVTVDCKLHHCTYEFPPGDLASKSAADLAKAAMDKCKAEIPKSCLDQFGGEAGVAKELEKIFADLKKGADPAEAAETHVTSAVLESVDVKCLADKGGEVTVKMCAIAITLIPTGASDALKEHEKCHAKIQEHYYCVEMKKYLEAKIEEVICAKKYESKDALKAEVEKLVSKFYKEFVAKVGHVSKYQKAFEDASKDKDGKVIGDAANQKAECDKVLKSISDEAKKLAGKK